MKPTPSQDIEGLAKKAIEAAQGDDEHASNEAYSDYGRAATPEAWLTLSARNRELEQALQFYANPKHWNDDGQCMTPDEYPAPMWAETDEPIVGGKLDLGDTARNALSPPEQIDPNVGDGGWGRG